MTEKNELSVENTAEEAVSEEVSLSRIVAMSFCEPRS